MLRCKDEFYACIIKAMTWYSNFGGRLVLLSVHDWLADYFLNKAWMPENANGLLKRMYQVGDVVEIVISITDLNYANDEEYKITCKVTKVEVKLKYCYDVQYTVEGLQPRQLSEGMITDLSHEDEGSWQARWEASGKRCL
jgi:hypothetical protein